MKKNFLKICLIFFLFIILAYVTNITAMPNNVILFQGEELNLGMILGISLKEDKNNYQSIETSSAIGNVAKVEKKKITLSLFNLIDVKKIEEDTIPKAYVIPLGNSVGLKLYTSGVLVVGMTEIEGKKPYENTGIEEGDMIVQVNQQQVTCTSELVNSVNKSNRRKFNLKIYKRW